MIVLVYVCTYIASFGVVRILHLLGAVTNLNFLKLFFMFQMDLFHFWHMLINDSE